MTNATLKQRVYEGYDLSEVSSIKGVHAAIRENIETEANDARQCMIMVHVDDNYDRVDYSDPLSQEVVISAYPNITHIDKANSLLSLDDPSSFNVSQMCVPSTYFDDANFNHARIFREKVLRSDTFSNGLDIPIFFHDLPINDFNIETLSDYLYQVILDALEVFYANKKVGYDEKILARRRISTPKFKQSLQQFSQEFLEVTKEAETGIEITEE